MQTHSRTTGIYRIALCTITGVTAAAAIPSSAKGQLGDEDCNFQDCRCDHDCDTVAERDSWGPERLVDPHFIKIRMRLIVFAKDDTTDRAVSAERVDAQIDYLNQDFADYGIQFDVDPVQVNDTCYRYLCNENYTSYCTNVAYCCDPPVLCCDSYNPQVPDCDFEDYQEVKMKNLYAEDPDQTLNVFVTSDPAADWAVYPWSSRADTATGGIVMNPYSIGGDDCGSSNNDRCTELTHEVGHALGLRHTHEWIEYANCATTCREPATCSGTCSSSECNERGDLCCDTPAGFASSCASISGTDECVQQSWPEHDYTNHMSYGGEGCTDHFTPQQARRMHCWVCNAVPGWIDSPDCNDNEKPDVCDISRGESDDCDENGVPDECQSWTMPMRRCCLEDAEGTCLVTTECRCDALGG